MNMEESLKPQIPAHGTETHLIWLLPQYLLTLKPQIPAHGTETIYDSIVILNRFVRSNPKSRLTGLKLQHGSPKIYRSRRSNPKSRLTGLKPLYEGLSRRRRQALKPQIPAHGTETL